MEANIENRKKNKKRKIDDMVNQSMKITIKNEDRSRKDLDADVPRQQQTEDNSMDFS